MKIDQLLKEYEVLNGNYKIISVQKRTISLLDEDLNLIYRGSIKFPKSLFYHYKYPTVARGYLPVGITFAINEEDDICYQPFFNIDFYGVICISSEDSNDINILTKSFYTQPFKYCIDHYANSIRQYTPSLLFDIYKNDIELKPASNDSIMKRIKTMNSSSGRFI